MSYTLPFTSDHTYYEIPAFELLDEQCPGVRRTQLFKEQFSSRAKPDQEQTAHLSQLRTALQRTPDSSPNRAGYSLNFHSMSTDPKTQSLRLTCTFIPVNFPLIKMPEENTTSLDKRLARSHISIAQELSGKVYDHLFSCLTSPGLSTSTFPMTDIRASRDDPPASGHVGTAVRFTFQQAHGLELIKLRSVRGLTHQDMNKNIVFVPMVLATAEVSPSTQDSQPEIEESREDEGESSVQ